MKRIKVIDSFRGIAALSVVLFHYTTNYRNDYLLPFSEQYDFRYGFLGVELFFIISGFVIFMTIEKIETTSEFLYKRFIRLFPIYWVCLLLSFMIVRIGGLTNRIVGYEDLLVNFTMFQALFGVKNVDGSYWSLFYELIFYIFIAFLILFRLKAHWQTICILWLIATIGINLGNIQSYTLNTILLLSNYNCLFIIGICFYKLFSDKNSMLTHLIIFGALAAFLFFRTYQANAKYEILIITSFILLFYSFVYLDLKFLELEFFQFFGKISYVLYLIHQNIGYVIIKYMIASYNPEHFYFLLVPLLIIIFLAYVIHKFIEKPLEKILKNRFNTRWNYK